MSKLLPVFLALIGLASGVGAGIMLRPQTAPENAAFADCPAPEADAAEPSATVEGGAETPGSGKENGNANFVKLNNQFVVPVVQEGRVSSLVVLSLSLELGGGGAEDVYKMEPKLRDAFLQVLFDHANIGGFNGNFTSGRKMQQLRSALLETARTVLGKAVRDVLIMDIVRQDA